MRFTKLHVNHFQLHSLHRQKKNNQLNKLNNDVTVNLTKCRILKRLATQLYRERNLPRLVSTRLFGRSIDIEVLHTSGFCDHERKVEVYEMTMDLVLHQQFVPKTSIIKRTLYEGRSKS